MNPLYTEQPAPVKRQYRVKSPEGRVVNAGTDFPSWFTIDEARAIVSAYPEYKIYLCDGYMELETL